MVPLALFEDDKNSQLSILWAYCVLAIGEGDGFAPPSIHSFAGASRRKARGIYAVSPSDFKLAGSGSGIEAA
jgi:hypothetical protein